MQRCLDSTSGRVTAELPRCVHPVAGGLVLYAFGGPGVSALRSLAGAATGGFEAIHLRFVLRTESSVGGFSVLLFARTIVESGVWIDPDREAGISMKTDQGRRRLGDPERHQCPFPKAERSRSLCDGRRPQQGEGGHEDGHSEIKVGAVKAQLHMPVRKALNHGSRGGIVYADAGAGRVRIVG